MNIYSIKPIKNGFVMRIDEECVVETYFEREGEALDALSSYLISRRIDLSKAAKE